MKLILVVMLALSLPSGSVRTKRCGLPHKDPLVQKLALSNDGQSLGKVIVIPAKSGTNSDLTVSLKREEQRPGLLKTLEDFGSLAAAMVALLAAAVSYVGFVAIPSRHRRIEVRLQYVEKQLQELYGPLLAECIRADSIFRKVEQVIQEQFYPLPHHHFRSAGSITPKMIADLKRGDPLPTPVTAAAFFAWALISIYLPSNKARVRLLQKNIHLFGPYPPLSFFLFLTHASQMEGLIDVKEHVNVSQRLRQLPAVIDVDIRDPYAIHPFPAVITAETIAKVAFLKALQREYQSKLGHFYARDLVFRNPYFLILEIPIDAKLSSEDSNQESIRLIQRANPLRKQLNDRVQVDTYFAPTCPLIWGPYAGIELMEMRSWLITKEIPMRKMESLTDSHLFICAMLQGVIATVAGKGKSGDIRLPLHYRVAQAFDTLDRSGVKSVPWKEDFLWSHIENDNGNTLDVDFNWYRRKNHPRDVTTLKDLSEPIGFAYKKGFAKLHT